MLMRIIACALVAGGLAGGASALMQQALVVPLLLEAELYESGAAVHFGAGAADPHAVDGHAHSVNGADGHAHEAAAGVARHLTTAVMTIAVNVGFALLLLAGFHARDARPSPREGTVWGVAGFVALMLAPSAGLAPELPGSAAGPLEARQLWWAATAVSAAAALWLIAFARQGWAPAVALVLLAAPHLAGAPEAGAHAGVAPPELAASFAARVLAVGLASWAVLGAVAAWAWGRHGRAAAPLAA